MALCDSSVLTGQEGSISFKPPGTSVCVRDFSAWGTDGDDTHITMECGADFRPGDIVTLTEEDGGKLDGSFTDGTNYKVQATGKIDGIQWITLSLTSDNVVISVAGDGGTGTADSPLPAHINIALADWYSVCGVREFSIDVSRDELDITTLPCSDGTADDGCETLVEFRSVQAGYASATGTMSVYFTCDQNNIANRLLGSTFLKSQAGAAVKLYVCTQYAADGTVNDADSLFIEAEIAITGVSFGVNPDDPTTGELSFSVRKIASAFGLTA